MKTTLSENWAKCGVEAGDTLLIHTSLRRTLSNYDTTPEIVLESFLDVLGEEGTLLLPLFNFEFTKGVPFDIRTTPSQMGALTEAGRLHPGAVRSGHPIYSFAAIGAKAYRFNVDNFSGYGSESPFTILCELDGKIGIIDLMDQNSMTFYHHIEELHDVPYRYHKEFTGNYTDAQGETTERTYSLFVRDIQKGVLTDVNPMGEVLWEKGLYTGDRPKEATGFRVISANEMFEEVSKVIKDGRAEELLYSIESDE
ncbi:MAG: SPBc2 prophage-derived aminoglycoside N(3')-acetyltransferase-like protein YokD [Chloroflexi bacterium]|nr:SPBc2 prophage-derived aminoglycoside N(3')-acetyltransferase-like protein YokD [Chloroflexota bacterium]